MKLFYRIWILLSGIILLSPFCIPAEIKDIIEPIKVKPGLADTFLVRDMFYSDSYDLKFTSTNNIAIEYLPEANKLVIKINTDFSGIDLIEFTLANQKYFIPVVSKSSDVNKILHKFSYKPESKINSVSVFGSFNDWKKDKDFLADADGNGVYELSLQLTPGSYKYKFFVDGKEITDPSNPEKAPTGFDDFNSVLNIKDQGKLKAYLHNYKLESKKGTVQLSFIYETENDKINLKKKNIIALLDNNKISKEQISIKKNKIKISIPVEQLQGSHLVRAAVTGDGSKSNFQNVFLVNGKPAGTDNNFSWHDGIIYSIMIDRFNDGDKSLNKPVVHDSLFPQANYQGGDLQGIIKKIEEGYFDSLNTNILWISPVYDNPNVAFREYPKPYRWYSGYHGYWPVSSTRIEEKFGDLKQLKELITKAHQHNIKVVLDFVAHHVHIDHPIYKEHPEWFGKLQLPDGRLNLRFWDEFRLTTWFEPYMPSFDFLSSPDAIKFMSENGVWWLKETGADGFRHDAVKHVPNELWRNFTQHIKKEIEIPLNKKVYQIGETFGSYELVKSYVNNGQLSSQFNFDLSYFSIPVFLEADKSFEAVDAQMQKTLDVFGTNHLMGNIMDSHDKVRFMGYADGDIKLQGVDTREIAWSNPPTVNHTESYKKAELYFAFMHTIPGLPVIYYGSEFGMTGADDPDNRRMMRFGDDLTPNEKRMLEQTKKITRLREEHSALRYGDFQKVYADNSVYAYLRCDMNEKLLVVLNKENRSTKVNLSIPKVYNVKEVVDVMNREKISGGNNITVDLPLIGWRVLRVKD